MPVAATTSETIDVAVSDLDSDMEPDQLVPKYLSIKGKLFEIDPEAVDPKPRKQAKGAKGRNAQSNVVQPPAVRKLTSQLQRLESDALFDQIEADAQWPAIRNELAQKKATERQQQPSNTNGESSQKPMPAPTPIKTPAWKKALKEPDVEKEEDEDVMLGGMFSVPDDGPINNDAAVNSDDKDISLRDFGKQTGVSPRRALEESIRGRYVRKP